MFDVKIKRVYDDFSPDDGKRFLVERLWPRGIKREELKIDGWLKDLAPSTQLRKWFGHVPQRWEEFRTKYMSELDENQRYLQPILEAIKSDNVTLLYSAKDVKHNGALVLKEYLEDFIKK